MRQFVARRNPVYGEQVVRRVARYLSPGLICLLLTHSTVAQDVSGSEQSSASDVALRGVMIPTGFQKKKYSAMIQVAVDGSPLPDAAWDLSASFAPQGQKPEDFSGRVAAGEPGTPVVLEFQVDFKPGPFALTLTARETTAGQSGSRTLEGRWPDPDTQRGTVSPVILLQPAQGAFLRGKNTRGQGALALGEEDAIRPRLPTAVVSVVCRAAALADRVRVERKLEGASAADFETIELLPGQERCAQVRDMIAPGTLTEGHFRYEVRLITDTGEIASAAREFKAAGGTQGSRPGS